jgi:hypothetical protein
MTCEACKQAAERVSAMFRDGCPGCMARSAARSPQFFEARQAGKLTPDYREMLQRLGVTHEAVKAAAAVDFESRTEGVKA